jgi:hypothetical protein
VKEVPSARQANTAQQRYLQVHDEYHATAMFLCLSHAKPALTIANRSTIEDSEKYREQYATLPHARSHIMITEWI